MRPRATGVNGAAWRVVWAKGRTEMANMWVEMLRVRVEVAQMLAREWAAMALLLGEVAQMFARMVQEGRMRETLGSRAISSLTAISTSRGEATRGSPLRHKCPPRPGPQIHQALRVRQVHQVLQERGVAPGAPAKRGTGGVCWAGCSRGGGSLRGMTLRTATRQAARSRRACCRIRNRHPR